MSDARLSRQHCRCGPGFGVSALGDADSADERRVLLTARVNDQMQHLRPLKVGVRNVRHALLVEIDLDVFPVAEDPELCRLAAIAQTIHFIVRELHLATSSADHCKTVTSPATYRSSGVVNAPDAATKMKIRSVKRWAVDHVDLDGEA